MIENHEQYKLTRHHARKFRKTLIALYQANDLSILGRVQVSSIESQLAELLEQIKEYEAK